MAWLVLIAVLPTIALLWVVSHPHLGSAEAVAVAVVLAASSVAAVVETVRRSRRREPRE